MTRKQRLARTIISLIIIAIVAFSARKVFGLLNDQPTWLDYYESQINAPLGDNSIEETDRLQSIIVRLQREKQAKVDALNYADTQKFDAGTLQDPTIDKIDDLITKARDKKNSLPQPSYLTQPIKVEATWSNKEPVVELEKVFQKNQSQ